MRGSIATRILLQKRFDVANFGDDYELQAARGA
jgi:hypothetical protein